MLLIPALNNAAIVFQLPVIGEVSLSDIKLSPEEIDVNNDLGKAL